MYAQESSPMQQRWEELSGDMEYDKGAKPLTSKNQHYKTNEFTPDDLDKSEHNTEKNHNTHGRLSDEEIIESRGKSNKYVKSGTAPVKKTPIDNRNKSEAKSRRKSSASSPYIPKNSGFWQAFLIVFSVVLIGVLLYFLLRNVSGFNKSISTPVDLTTSLDPSTVEEDEYQTQLKNALANQDYRLALRINYLIVLRLLIEKNKVEWEKEKTNAHYLLTLKGTPFHDLFFQVVNAFDRVWYGHYAIDAISYEKFASVCNQLLNQLKNNGK